MRDKVYQIADVLSFPLRLILAIPLILIILGGAVVIEIQDRLK